MNKNKLCVEPSCTTVATFGHRGAGAISCAAHRKPDYEDVRSKQCEQAGCTTVATFGPQGGGAISCAAHRKPDYENVRCKQCEQAGCTTQASFGPQGAGAISCAAHRKPDYEDVVSKQCEQAGCTSQATFGPQGGGAISCAAHRKPDYEKVRNDRCAEPGCTTIANFPNKAGEAYSLCHRHAVEAGTAAGQPPGTSKIACVAMDQLADEGHPFQHVHLNPTTKRWEGKEEQGLVRPRRHRPDGVQRRVDGEVEKVFFYHGNRYHGWPPGHKFYDTEAHLPVPSKEDGHLKVVNTRQQYEKTMADMQLFKTAGFAVFFLWEHRHKEWQRMLRKRGGNPRPALWSYVQKL